MLDDLDRELDSRGHRFVRYADDLRVYVSSERAAQRVLGSVSVFVEGRLKLKVNREKSAVDRATRRGLLGFGLFFRRGGMVAIRIDTKALRRLRWRIRCLTARNWGVSMQHRIAALNTFISGWCAYFALADTPSVFAELDEWLRRRLRQVRWKEWKRPRGRRRALSALGIPMHQAIPWACTRKGSWRLAGSAPLQRAMPNAYWQDQGLNGFRRTHARLRVA